MTTEQQKKELALFRFSLIAPVVSGTFKEESKMAYFRSATKEPCLMPDGRLIRFSPLTLKKWYQYYTTGGLEALIPHNRIDLGKSRALTDDVCQQIHAYRQTFPRITGKMIYEKLIEDGYMKKADASLDTVYRYMKQADLTREGMPPEECLAYEFAHANDCWQADTTMGPVIVYEKRKRQTYLISFIDDASRLLLHGEFFFEDNAINMQHVFRKAIQKFGIPKKAYFDNGCSYRNTQLEWICASLGIVKIHTKPYVPKGHGKIERSHRTAKDGWQNATDWNEFHCLEDVNKSYHEFLDKKYNHSKHSSIDKSPKERYLEDFDRIRFAEESQLYEQFLHRITRKVTPTATISLFRTVYEVPQQYIGYKIIFRYNPEDMSEIYIYEEETGQRKHRILPVKKVDNAKRKRRPNIDYGRMDGGNSDV